MNDMMKKLLKEKKQKGMLSDEEASAKLSVLKNLRSKDDSGSMMDKLKNIKKVSVIADSKEGLEKGLDTAKQAIDSHPTEIESPEVEHEKMTHDEFNDCSEEEIDSLLEKLMAKKEELKSSKES